MVKIIQQKPAFKLSAYDYNGQGEEILINWEDLKKASVGKRWVVNSGNVIRDCCTYDSLEVLFKTDNIVLTLHDWEWIGSYPNYPVSHRAELILFILNPEIEFKEEIKRIIKHD